MNHDQPKPYFFRNSKEKKTNRAGEETQRNNSRSLSERSDAAKKSVRAHNQMILQKQMCLQLTKKEKEIREAIEYRYKKSKMRGYVVEFADGSQYEEKKSLRNRSSEMDEFKEMQRVKVVNLKEFHEKQHKKLVEEKERSIKNLLKIRTKSGFVIKTEGSEKSIETFRFLKPYLGSQTPKNLEPKIKVHPQMTKSGDDSRFISMQIKEKSRNNKDQSKSREIKISSHRTLTVEKDGKIKTKATQSQWDFVPMKANSKFNKKYRF